MYFITSHLIIYLTACRIILTRILIAHFTFLINFNDAMSHLFIVKRLELYMDLALYKINILLLLLLSISCFTTHCATTSEQDYYQTSQRYRTRYMNPPHNCKEQPRTISPFAIWVNLRMFLSTRIFGGFTIPWGP